MGKSAHHRGYFSPVAPAALAACCRPPSLARPLRLLTAVPLVLMQMLLLVGCAMAAVAAAATVAWSAQTIAHSKIFARLRRAIFSRACGARGVDSGSVSVCPWRACWCVFRTFQGGAYVVRGSSDDKIFLLHESIDLDELVPTVRVSQKVHRQKYFFSDVRM